MFRGGRRRFLSLTAGVGALAMSSSGRKLLQDMLGSSDDEHSTTEVSPGSGRLQVVKQSSWALGSEVSIVALHHQRSVAQQAISAAFAELELVEEIMSLYRDDSQLSRLNRFGVLHSPHLYLVKVLKSARQMSQQTRGAFDVTVQPLWEMYATAARANVDVDFQQLKEARSLVDYRQVEIASDIIRLHGQGTKITLNGIAQGFASDRAVAIFQEYGVTQALIDTGEISSLGRREDSSAWQIGIQHPRQPDAYISLAELSGRCMATSGDYATKFSSDYSQHHLLDPHTGKSPTQLASVSVVATTAMQADAVSTAVFVLGAEHGGRLVQSLRGVDCLLVHKDGRVQKTAGFPTKV